MTRGCPSRRASNPSSDEKTSTSAISPMTSAITTSMAIDHPGHAISPVTPLPRSRQPGHVGGQLYTRGQAELGEDMRDMGFSGAPRNHQPGRDLPVPQALGNQVGYLALARRQFVHFYQHFSHSPLEVFYGAGRVDRTPSGTIPFRVPGVRVRARRASASLTRPRMRPLT